MCTNIFPGTPVPAEVEGGFAAADCDVEAWPAPVGSSWAGPVASGTIFISRLQSGHVRFSLSHSREIEYKRECE